AGGHHAAGRVDVQADVLLGILRLEEQHLRHDHVRHVVVDGADEEDHPLLEQARVDVVGPFATAGLLDHHGNEVQGCFGLVHCHLSAWLLWESPRAGARALAGEPDQLPMASWKLRACSVCWARSAIQSITCSSITRFCNPDISWGSLRYNSMTWSGSS